MSDLWVLNLSEGRLKNPQNGGGGSVETLGMVSVTVCRSSGKAVWAEIWKLEDTSTVLVAI
jgi:hypothetical protein